jgi:hypothetical protein
MSRIKQTLANGIWLFSILPEAFRYRKSLKHGEAVQLELLQSILSRNADTVFGRHYGFAGIRSPQEYQAAVPLGDYGDFEPYIARIAAGEEKVLTKEPVLLLEPTGGSSFASKLIPYTEGLREQFQKGLAPWIADLFLHLPSLIAGKSYWAITPAAGKKERTAGGIPIGFDDDSEYLGWAGRLFRSVQAVPEEVKLIGNMESFWYVTLLFLLRSHDLALISIWNPTFLTILCDHLHSRWRQLADDIAAGALTPPLPLDPHLAERLSRRNPPDPDRSKEVRAAFAADTAMPEIHRALWPRLRVISCWRDAAASGPAAELAGLFPQAIIQGKGLLATEGFATLPLIGRAGCLPALCSHFFEFLPAGNEEALLLHQLETGKSYSLIITTAGGLYRYRLQDMVTVEGFHNDVPLLIFAGKEECISDHYGEKLHEDHVRKSLQEVTERAALQPKFAMLAIDEQRPPAYALYIEAPQTNDRELRRIGEMLDELLRMNCQYRYCRDLGQLAQLRVFRISGNGCQSYLSRCNELGQRLGDIKPTALHQRSGWTGIFRGSMLD